MPPLSTDHSRNSERVEKREPTVLAETRFLQFVERDGWSYVHRRCKGVVAVIAVVDTAEGPAIALTDQARIPVGGRRVIDLPAGLVGDDAGAEAESSAAAAIRELREETGVAAPELTQLFERPSSAGLSSEVITYFMAQFSERVSEGGGIGNERIKTHIVPLAALRQFLRNEEACGALIDPKIDVALRVLMDDRRYRGSLLTDD